MAGLISSVVSTTFGPFFNGTRFVVLGPTNATAILLLTGLASSGLPADQRILALPVFVLMVGGFLILGAMANASLLINYISRTVVTGYVTAAALFIFVNQIQNVLGFKIGEASTFLGIVSNTIRSLPLTYWPEVLMAVAALAIQTGLTLWAPKWPNIVFTLVLTSLLGVGFSYVGWSIASIQDFSFAEIRLLPGIYNFELVGNLAIPALALAFVSILEATSIGKTLSARAGQRFDVNQEMYAMGLANTASAVCGGMNASGSLTRSMLAETSGARSPLANVYSGIVVLLLLFTVGPLIQYIPKAALAVLVMGIALSLFNRHNIRLALRTTRSDTIVFTVTCSAALLLTIDAAIFLGAFVSILLFLHKAGTPDLVEYNFNPEGQLAKLADRKNRAVPGISIMHAEGDLFFGSTDLFDQQIREVIGDPSLKIIILRLKNARNLDATAAAAIEELHSFLRKSGRHLLISGAIREVTRVLGNSGFIDKLGPENFFREIPSNPNLSTRDALKRATEILGRRDAEIRIFVDKSHQNKQENSEEGS